MEVGTGRALSAVILVTWTATPGETARARRGSKNSSVRGCEWAPQLLHSCVPSPGPAPFFFYLRSSFNILAEPSRARTEKERERMAGVRFLLGPRPNPRFLPSPPRRANFSSASFVARGGTNTKSSWKAPLIVLNAIDNLDIARMYTRGATRMLAGDLTDRAIFVEQRGHRLASSGQGALVLPPVPSSPPLVFETLKLPGCSNSWGRVLIVNRRGSRKWGRMISTEVVLEMISLS